MAEHQSFWSSWQERLTALRNTPPVLKIVWQSGPGVVIFGLVARLFAAVLPLALLWIPKLIVDAIVHARVANQVVSPRLWWLVGAEFGLAVLTSIFARAIDYSDSLLADKYTRYVSIQVMKHAAELDLIAYEDPVFYDRLERARVQATDRLGMIQQIGRLIQLVITTITLSVTIIVYSPWLMLLLIAGVLPAFLGESHFAFLGYAKNFRQTPVRRQLDYLRLVGGSKEAAKELKLFGLSKFLTQRFTQLSDGIYEENVALSRRKLIAGGFLSVIATMGYYSAYVFVIWRTFTGAYSIGAVVLAVGSDSAGQQQHSADFLDGLRDRRPGSFPHRPAGIFRYAAHHPVEAGCAACAPADCSRIRVSQCFVSLSGKLADGARWLNFHLHPGERVALIGENGAGQDHDCEADYAALRSHRRPGAARRSGPARVSSGGPVSRNWRYLSGLYAL